MNHFVVLERVSSKGFDIHDPAKGRRRLSKQQVSDHFTGVVLELAPGVHFTRETRAERISIRQLTGRIDGLVPSLVQILGLAFVIELLALSLPLQIQLVVDHVLLSSDRGMLTLLTVVFFLVVVSQVGLGIARAWLISWIGASINAQWVINLFSHLMKLPLDFFEKRHMGDIVSRFSSTQAIPARITGNFIEAILDGIMGFSALLMLFLYSGPLTVLVIAAFVLYGACRLLFYKAMWRVNEEQLTYGARQQTELMESVRGVQAIKLAGKQSERKARLANATWEAVKRSMHSQRLSSVLSATNQGIFGAQRILLIAIGAYLAISKQMSVGMLLAFVAYADQFSSKVGNLIDKLVDFRMLRLHVERISDVALSEPESGAGVVLGEEVIEPSFKLRNVAFRYSESEPWIIKNLNLEIKAGESVAIVGESGCGKSTLAKLILGLLRPVEGNIEIGGYDIEKIGLERYRKMLGAVMQDDQLVAGSIADNIAFFDDNSSMESIREAAVAAAIHGEIVTMPMGYETLVGDMGSSLSGGQKQRVVLARALYRQPKVIVLDEATSHLDSRNEALTNETIKKLNITRIIIAHRAETIAQADRTISLARL